MTESVLTKNQVKTFVRAIDAAGWGGKTASLKVQIRYDDECGNGHNSFAITGDIHVDGRWQAGGCLHEEIAKAFPEFAPLIKWHLFDSTGPMYYIANTVYHAGDRDCYGRRAGEPSSFSNAVKFGDFPILWRDNRANAFFKWLKTAQGSDFEVLRIDHKDTTGYKFGPKFTLGGAPDNWHECPFDTEIEALEFLEAMKLGWKILQTPTAYSEGKQRELDHARSTAVWPDATDEDLTAPGLEERLKARLPKLLEEFRAAVESLGFTY